MEFLQIDVPVNGSLDRWVIYALLVTIVVVVPGLSKYIAYLYNKRLEEKDKAIKSIREQHDRIMTDQREAFRALLIDKNEIINYERSEKERAQASVITLLSEITRILEKIETK